ncbi:MAG: PAS domain S-box protein [Betaproteobacteria bacterium]|nr:PAS domain S-box protein [Betaproteobacteria bacterium]
MTNAPLDECFHRLLDAAADAMLVADAAGNIVLANTAAARLFGYEAGALAGLAVERLVPEPLRARYREQRGVFALRPTARRVGIGAELRALRRDGAEFPAEIHLSPLEDGLVLATVHDVSERRQVDEALRKFSRAIEQTASTVVITDRDGVIEYVNPRFTQSSGYSAAEAIGQRPSLLKSGHTSPEEYARLWQTITAGGTWQGEFHNRRKDGSLYWESAIVSPIRDEEGRITHFVGIKDDITTRKRTEQELRERRTEVERLLKLHVASQTAAAIAHELNQPLNAIAAYSEAALRLLRAGNPKPERLAHALEHSAHQAQRAGRVVRDLLAFLHQAETPMQALDLNAVVGEALHNVRAEGYLGRFQTVLELAPDLPPVKANRLQVEKVIANLLRNGVEAMEDAGLTAGAITVTLRTAADDSFAHVTVRDTGPGLDPDAARRIFEPFYTTKRRGLGMGLAISRALIEAHGGRLWVDTAAAPGATFHFTLPFAA